MAHPSQRPPSRIAVVAVHGVADQPPQSSARAIADLLLNLADPEQRPYGAFTEHPVRIPVRALEPDQDQTKTFEVRAREYRESPAREQLGAIVDPSQVLMEDQLRDFELSGSEAQYETVRLESRLDREPASEMHVYEMYWADLSRAAQGLLSVLGELYQLILHVPSLGRHTVDAAWMTADVGDSSVWPTLQKLERAGAHLLAAWIPVLSLWLLGCVLLALSGTLVTSLSERFQPLPGLLIVTVAVVVGRGVALLEEKRGWGLSWSAQPLLILGAAAVGYLLVYAWSLSYTLFAVAVLGLLAFIGRLLMTAYEKRRKEVSPFWQSTGLLVLAGLASQLLLVPRTEPEVLTAGFRVAEFVFVALTVSWIVFLVVQLCAWAVGWYAVSRAADRGAARTAESGTRGADAGADTRLQESREREAGRNPPVSASMSSEPALDLDAMERRADRLKRAEWTARLCLALPAALFIIVTIMLWTALYGATATIATEALYDVVLLDWVGVPSQLRHSELAWQMITLSTPELILLLALVGVAILFLFWGLFPVVWAEVRPPRQVSAREAEAKQKASRPAGATVHPSAAALGNWLNNGLRVARRSGLLIVLAVALILPVAVILPVAGLLNTSKLIPGLASVVAVFRNLAAGSEQILQAMGVLVGGSAVGLLALGGRLKKLAGGFRPWLDVLLDVDSYLREHPVENNPRARICARYVSLLRHLCGWVHADGGQYQALIVVAHSQGSVISADLLRYLKGHRDRSLERLCTTSLPVYLFTMGCPLRQLYGQRFPHLYRWARHEDVGPWTRSMPSDIPPNQAPNPADLNVRMWVNVYRSGDYVGRALWRPEQCDYLWDVPAEKAADDDTAWNPRFRRPVNISEDSQRTRREYCIGAGAHTHYWDDTAEAVAQELHGLIEDTL